MEWSDRQRLRQAVEEYAEAVAQARLAEQERRVEGAPKEVRAVFRLGETLVELARLGEPEVAATLAELVLTGELDGANAYLRAVVERCTIELTSLGWGDAARGVKQALAQGKLSSEEAFCLLHEALEAACNEQPADGLEAA